MVHVADERSEVEAERDAFAAFVERVDACPARPPSRVASEPHPRTSVRPTVNAAAAPDRSARLRQAYRETVMAVDHYDAVYGESLATNAATELGTDVATALCGGVPVTAALKTALYDAAVDARAERERFGAVLRRERRSLADAHAELDDVVTDLCRHQDIPRTRPDDGKSPSPLPELERRCEHAGDERQAVVQRQLQFARVDDALYDYLYGDRSWTYPVLSTVATLVEDITAARRRASEAHR